MLLDFKETTTFKKFSSTHIFSHSIAAFAIACDVLPYRFVIYSPREPWLTPTLIAVPFSLHASMSFLNCRLASSWSLLKLPGFILTFSTIGATAMAVSDEK